MKKLTMASALMLTLGVSQAAPITSLELTGGTFSINGGFSTDEIFPGEFANMTVGGYDGGDRIAADLAVNSIAYFTLSTWGPVLTSTQANPFATFSHDTILAPPDGGSYRPLTGDITDDILTLDLHAWTAWFAGASFNQGTKDLCVLFDDGITERCSSDVAVTTYDVATGTFTARWDSVFEEGYALSGGLGSWYIEGKVSTIPVPAAVWLFGSGLIGLAGIARRKKA